MSGRWTLRAKPHLRLQKKNLPHSGFFFIQNLKIYVEFIYIIQHKVLKINKNSRVYRLFLFGKNIN